MYTNKGSIQNYLMIDIDASFDTQIERWISVVKSYIDKYTGRKDGFESASSVKYFDGNGKREIDIDECTSVTSVQVLEANGDGVEFTLVAGLEEDYVTYPYNTTPIYRLKLVANSQLGAFYSGEKRVKVTAIWGHSTSVPADIELAATMLVSSIIDKGLRGGKVQSESLGDYSVTYGGIDETAQAIGVKSILNKYKLFNL